MILQRLIVVFVCLLSAPGAFAQTKSFERVLATYDRAAAEEKSADAAINRLRTYVEKRDIKSISSMLSKDFTAILCAEDPTTECLPGIPGVKAPSSKLTAVQRMEQGMCCLDTPFAKASRKLITDTILQRMDASLSTDLIAAHPELPNTICAPAVPKMDRRQAKAMLDATGADPRNLRVTDDPVVLRERPAKDAPVASTIPAGTLVAFMIRESQSLPRGWLAIAMPQGGLGYQDTSLPAYHEYDPRPPSLCMKREESAWRISLFIEREMRP
jgi:hypothetical protein